MALSNTTLGMPMATIDASIVIISLPAIFRGIDLDPLAPGNVSYLLWMIMGYLLVTAVLVVTLGRLGDMYGRVRIYNLGFVVFTLASIALSLDPLTGSHGRAVADRLAGRAGGRRGDADRQLGRHPHRRVPGPTSAAWRWASTRSPAIAGQFVGLLLGGLLAEWDWRAVFWVNVPIGIVGTIWSYRALREIGVRPAGRGSTGAGNITFARRAEPAARRHHVRHPALRRAHDRLDQPVGGRRADRRRRLLVAFCVIETKVAEPMFQLGLFRIRAFAAGNVAGLLGSIARGGLQFMLIIWLQGIWLPLHGYDFADTPLWAGIYMLPLTVGFLVAGPVSGYLSDRFGAAPVRHRRPAGRGVRVLRPDAAAGRLPVLGVRAAHLLQRDRLGPVRLAQHLGDHEQRPGPPARLGVGHAGHLPELRDGAVDRHLLLADDRRPGRHPAAAR